MTTRMKRVWPTDAPADKNGYCVVAIEQEQAGILYCLGDYKTHDTIRHDRVNMVDNPVVEKRYPYVEGGIASQNLNSTILYVKECSKAYDDLHDAHCARDHAYVKHYEYQASLLPQRIAASCLDVI